MSVIGYVSASAGGQDVRGQRDEIIEYARSRGFHVDRFAEAEFAGRRRGRAGVSTKLPGRPKARDLVVVSELSRLGRSLSDVITVMNELIKRGTRFVAIREKLEIGGTQGLQPEPVLAILPLLLQVERELISTRTRKALAVKRDQGVILGRPKGSLGRSKLDSRKSEILGLLKDRASLSFIARRFRVSLPTVVNFVKSRKLREVSEKGGEAL